MEFGAFVDCECKVCGRLCAVVRCAPAIGRRTLAVVLGAQQDVVARCAWILVKVATSGGCVAFLRAEAACCRCYARRVGPGSLPRNAFPSPGGPRLHHTVVALRCLPDPGGREGDGMTFVLATAFSLLTPTPVRVLNERCGS